MILLLIGAAFSFCSTNVFMCIPDQETVDQAKAAVVSVVDVPVASSTPKVASVDHEN